MASDESLREVIEDALARPPHERFPYLDRELRTLAEDNPRMESVRKSLNYARETRAALGEEIEFELDHEKTDFQFVEADKEILRQFNEKLDEELRSLVEQNDITAAAVAEMFKSVAAPAIVEDWEEREDA